MRPRSHPTATAPHLGRIIGGTQKGAQRWCSALLSLSRVPPARAQVEKALPGEDDGEAVESSSATLVETEEGLASLDQKPMTIFWGDQDFVFDHKFLAEWERRFPAAKVYRYPSAGHYVLEDAGDEIIPRIEAFLNAP